MIRYRADPLTLAAEIDAIVTELAVVPTEVILPAYLIAALPVGIVMVCALTLAFFYEKPMELAFMEQVCV